MPDVFLSYSREDQATARKFADSLEREGFSVWWDQSLRSGEAYDKVTEAALREAGAVVVLWSKNSVDSRWVRAEATTADRRGTLMPVMIEPCERPIMFELTHTADLAHWKGETKDPAWRSFLGDVRRFIENGRKQAPPVELQQPTPASTTVRFRSGRMIALGIAAMLIGAGVLWFAQHRGDTAVEALPAAAAQTGPVTLAVLPFADLSQAQDQQYFSDGLTEEILNQLAQNRGLRVTGRTSSFSFKGKNEDLRRIAEQLGVANLLEGSIRKDGDSLRITAQLIDGRDGAHLWSRTYARELKQVFTVQEEIASDVAQALSITLDVGETSRATGGTTHVDAYYKYLQARGLGFDGSVELIPNSIRLLREAVALDPGFSRAWLLLGNNLATAAISTLPPEAVSLRKEGAEAHKRGIALAPDSFTAQAVGITQLVDQHQWAEADVLFRKVRAITGQGGQIQIEGGGFLDYLNATGRIRESIMEVKDITQVEPLSLLISTSLQTLLTATGQYEAAQVEYVRSKALTGNRSRANFRALLRLIYLAAEPQVVQEEFRRQTVSQDVPAPFVRAVIESLGDREAARAILRQAIGSSANHNQATLTATYQLADALGERELALSALRKLVVDINSPLSLWLAPHSGVRSDPQFKQLLRETGLAEHFRSTGNWGNFCKPVGNDDFECS